MKPDRNDRLPVVFVVVLGALSGFAPLSIDMYLPGLPSLQRHFASSASAAQLTLTACLLGLAFAQVAIGPISDRIGRRRPLLIGVALYVVVSFACAAAPSLLLFTLLRFVQGAAGAAGIVISRAMVRDLRSGARAVRLYSTLQLVNGFFPAFAPVVGAQLLRIGSWRFIFVVLALLGLALLGASTALLPETLMVSARSVGGLSETLRSFRELARDRAFVGYALVSGFVVGAMFAYIAGSPFVLEEIFGVSAQTFSAIFAVNAAGIVVMSQVGSALVRRVGPDQTLLVGVAWSLLGATLLLASLELRFGLWGVLPALFVTVSAVGIAIPSATALAMADYPHIAGSASGLLGVLQFVIGASCAPIVGAFGTKTAIPMATVIVVLSLLAFGLRAGVARSADGVDVAGEKMDHEAAMRVALEQAALGERDGDVPVGAVILHDGVVIAAGHNEREHRGDPTAHAEVITINRAAVVLGRVSLEECTLVVTLEPCVMCAGAVLASGVARVVFGAFDQKAGACGSRYNLLADPRLGREVPITSGVLADQAAAQLTAFFSQRRVDRGDEAAF